MNANDHDFKERHLKVKYLYIFIFNQKWIMDSPNFAMRQGNLVTKYNNTLYRSVDVVHTVSYTHLTLPTTPYV